MINKMNFRERSLLFAKLSQFSYKDLREFKASIKPLGFTNAEFYDRDGAQAYRIWNKQEVDDLWPMVKDDLLASRKNRSLWFTGHSLGAAMATIMAGRCMHEEDLQDPIELYTYGSPRSGWKKYVKHLNIKHHRWVNNNDIVTRVPLAIMLYKHDGTEHYMNSYGNVRTMTKWQRVKDRWRGMLVGLKNRKIDNFSDHSMDNYVANLEIYVSNMEVTQNK